MELYLYSTHPTIFRCHLIPPASFAYTDLLKTYTPTVECESVVQMALYRRTRIPFISSKTRQEQAHGHIRILSMPPPSESTTLLSWGRNLESGPHTGWRSSWFGYFPGTDCGIELCMIHKRLLPHLSQFLICKSAKAIISYEVKNSIWNITRGNQFLFSVQRTYDPCGSLKSSKINTQCPINRRSQ